MATRAWWLGIANAMLLDSQKHGFTWANKDKTMVQQQQEATLLTAKKYILNTLTLTTLSKGYLKQAVWGPYKLLRFILCGRNQAFDRPLESCGTYYVWMLLCHSFTFSPNTYLIVFCISINKNKIIEDVKPTHTSGTSSFFFDLFLIPRLY